MSLVSSLALAAIVASRDTVPCIAGEWTLAMRDDLVELMVRDDSTSRLRRAAYRLPRTPPDEIVPLTDAAECTRLAARYYQRPGLRRSHAIGVVRVGAHHVVLGDDMAGEWIITLVLDPHGRVVASVAR